jgi:3-methylcrotonyl-CoA carboxylase alpha subunit
MFKNLLIANRGEIARRVMRTAKRLGIRTLAVYSDADARAAFVREADCAMRIGPAPPKESYLDGQKILAAARAMKADAVHPGYGFLSENADFAESVEKQGLIWVGAPPAAIHAMGFKNAAKKLMQAAGVPVTPGYFGADQSLERLAREADGIGYPVLIKAVAGGGGKGMRRVERRDDFAVLLEACKREALSAFGDERVLIEKYVERPRHIEVQVFGDRHGNYVHLFERDCSLQRRHQKVIEEAPAPGLDGATRAWLTDAALKAAKAVKYVGAGTVEFIADSGHGLSADRIWFMEMNTRLQVEHPVTEAITGQDLVEWQLRVAAGETLPKKQSELSIQGWAMEARLYAENPATGFLPSTGGLEHLSLPGKIRVDSGVEEGDEITPYYDPLIAKLVVHEASRGAAVEGLAKACGRVQVWPVKTNAAFLGRAATHPAFVQGGIDTSFAADFTDVLIPASGPPPKIIAAAAEALLPRGDDNPWVALTGFRACAPPEERVAVEVAGKTYLAKPVPAGEAVKLAEHQVLFLDGEAWSFSEPQRHAAQHSDSADGAILAPMPGAVVMVEVKKGQGVKRGQRLLVLQAMKMEYALQAPFDGAVAELMVTSGAQVQEGALLARIEKAKP